MAILAFFFSSAQADIHHYFTTIKSSPNALYAFFKKMPKGGELHYHLAGGAYPETMISLAAKANYCIQPQSFTLYQPKKDCQAIHSASLSTNPKLHQNVIRAWSMHDFIPTHETGHDHFFASFFKFMPVVSDHRPQLLASVMKRAADQNELYMEIMMLPDNAHSASFGATLKPNNTFEGNKQLLLQNADFQANVRFTIQESKRILKEARTELGCEQNPGEPVCKLTVKFQYYILRQQEKDAFFAQALNAFASASKSPDIVGINIVQEEDGLISRRDYREHMRILNFMHQAYPAVHIALHAGELSPDTVKPEDLRFHIHEAVLTGHAERIGHGVSIAHEENATALLKHMAEKPVPVEINLTSNEKILNIKGEEHPLRHYLKNHVPVVLSTDDEGILRTDLTREYVQAVLEHHLDYETIKSINRNAITYSFLPGKSIWQDNRHHVPVRSCQKRHSAACKDFLKHSEKARLQWQLEQFLIQFEQAHSTR